MTTTTNPPLLGTNQATAAQLQKWNYLRTEKPGRIMAAEMDNGFLKINYRTLGGFYVTAVFNQYGEEINKQYFSNWNEDSGEPFNLISSK